jgi:hypothetical protein
MAICHGEDPFKLMIQAPPTVLDWPSASNVSYQVEWTSNLFNPAWQPLTNVTGTGSNISISASLPAQSTRFYRLAITTPPDEVALEVAAGAVRFLRAVLDTNATGTGGLPRNEATLSELTATNFSQDFFVPAQLGTWMTVAVLGHALRSNNPAFTAGFDTADLTNHLAANVNAISNILATSAFTNSEGKAFYQVHLVPSGAAPRATDYDNTISLLDNTLLVVGMQVASAYVMSFDTNLASRIAALLTQFNLRLWFTNDQMFIGGPKNPRTNSTLDRIVSEGRLSPVAALARAEISGAEFTGLIRAMIAQSRGSSGSVSMQSLPFYGTSLEIWSPTPYLSGELNTAFGSGTLKPMVTAWEQTRRRLDLPAAGATGAANGFGQFGEFAFTSAESSSTNQDRFLVVLPAVGMQAGAIGHADALANLGRAFHAAKLAGEFQPTFGFPNYLDSGSGLVNTTNPVWGTLEIGQMAVALLNHLLGGQFLETLLRQDAGWANALDQYYSILDDQLLNHIFLQGEEPDAGSDGRNQLRSVAYRESTRWLNTNEMASYTFLVGRSGNYSLTVRYSKDDSGSGDDVAVLLDGTAKGNIHALATGSGGQGWNVFTTSPPLSLGPLSAGPHTIRLQVSTNSNNGFEIDLLDFIRAP